MFCLKRLCLFKQIPRLLLDEANNESIVWVLWQIDTDARLSCEMLTLEFFQLEPQSIIVDYPFGCNWGKVVTLTFRGMSRRKDNCFSS